MAGGRRSSSRQGGLLSDELAPSCYKRSRGPHDGSPTTCYPTAPEIIETLRAHQQALRQAGITRLSLFGSVARNEGGPDSDIDLAAEFDPAAKMDLIRLVGLERELGDVKAAPVEIVPEPVKRPRLRANLERDRIRAF